MIGPAPAANKAEGIAKVTVAGGMREDPMVSRPEEGSLRAQAR